MKTLYKVLRSLLFTLLALLFILPAALYVALSLPSTQRWLTGRTEQELSKLLNTKVDIDFIEFSPFNRVTLHRVTVMDDRQTPALTVDRLGAGLSLWALVAHEKVVVNYAELIGMNLKVYRDSVGAPLNIQPIIDALSPKDKTKPPTKFDLRINNVVIRTSAASYDILDQPRREGRFDPAHIGVTNFSADLRLPQIKNDDFIAELRRLTLSERSGFTLENLSGKFHIASNGLAVNELVVKLPYTRLAFAPISLAYSSWNDLKQNWSDKEVAISLLDDSYLDSRDATAFVPALKDLDLRFDARLQAEGTARDFHIEDLELTSPQGANIKVQGDFLDIANAEIFHVDIPTLELKANGPRLVTLVTAFAEMKPNVRKIISNLGDVQLDASVSGNLASQKIDADLTSGAGNVTVRLDASRRKLADGKWSAPSLDFQSVVSGFSGKQLAEGIGGPLADIEYLDAVIDAKGRLGGKYPVGDASLKVEKMTYKGREFNDLTAEASSTGKEFTGHVDVDNAGLSLLADANLNLLADGQRTGSLSIDARQLETDLFNPSPEQSGYTISAHADAEFSAREIDDATGHVHISDLECSRSDGRRLSIDNICLNSYREAGADSITLVSDLVDGKIQGRYTLSSVIPAAKNIVAQLIPAISGNTYDLPEGFWNDEANNGYFDYRFNLKTLQPIENFVKLPVSVIHPISIDGRFDAAQRLISLYIDAPYLQQGNRLIEGSSLSAVVNGPTVDRPLGNGSLTLSTTLPTKKGEMKLQLNSDAVEDHIDSRIGWKINRKRDFSGEINTSTAFSRDDVGDLITRLDFNRSNIVFNDTVWTVEPSTFTMHGKEIDISGFKAWHGHQYVTIDGRASASSDDSIVLALNDINLDYVFETLDIPTAQFGGDATGRFYASNVLTANPVAYTPELKVKNLTYNHSLMGDAVIRAAWENDTKAAYLHADISQPNGGHSTVDGRIFALDEALDLTFEADRIAIGFLQYYMQAFASKVSGYASGKARLYGTFKDIDMTGDVYGQDVAITLGFTGCTYTTTDSVFLRPGRIQLDNLLLADQYGNHARLNGWLTHKCFHEPRFNFQISDARDLLVYDVGETPEQPWYGRVFGNGRATVVGEPGRVDIGVNMQTAPKSSFTFVLSDALNAQEYNFITFRDRDQARKDSIAALSAPPEAVRQLKERMKNNRSNDKPSDYNMTINVDVTPQALVTLVMDPVGGDAIKAHGHGNLTMKYGSADESLSLTGTYTVDNGKYNFTLQDIIRKDFTINEGSSIAFNGDPYAAQLNINAKYTTHGNLTDLDESFLEDKELNRTNVTVDALMNVTGDMRQPEIAFDLGFPTLTEETRRKVMSIVNTEDMMNRQIIYLLAMNRFYTPDYMTATRGNELVSVASSTISSQLSNMLGQLSDNWNIAPNFRSARGDFSDVEVDVALSSHLLNNRLLLNGNLGYRDKSLNNNSFIGDFDIEYLLNRSGSFRLKAYNRYNDQNYYLKSALTTQGVGIVFKRDFDNMFSFLRPLFRHKKKSDETKGADAKSSVKTAQDSVKTTPVQPTLQPELKTVEQPADTLPKKRASVPVEDLFRKI